MVVFLHLYLSDFFNLINNIHVDLLYTEIDLKDGYGASLNLIKKLIQKRNQN